MLAEPGKEYTGGTFETIEADGSLSLWPMHRGDVLVFPSHKFHSLDKVMSGLRQVMIIEFWAGTGYYRPLLEASPWVQFRVTPLPPPRTRIYMTRNHWYCYVFGSDTTGLRVPLCFARQTSKIRRS